jgi:hypothetical protein
MSQEEIKKGHSARKGFVCPKCNKVIFAGTLSMKKAKEMHLRRELKNDKKGIYKI